jgi:hypothetical protein
MSRIRTALAAPNDILLIRVLVRLMSPAIRDDLAHYLGIWFSRLLALEVAILRRPTADQHRATPVDLLLGRNKIDGNQRHSWIRRCRSDALSASSRNPD